MTGGRRMMTGGRRNITAGDLKKWLQDKPDDAPIEIMIENAGVQYQFPANDVAASIKYPENKISYLVIIHEEEK